MAENYYFIPSDLAIIQQNDGKVLFRSDNLAIRMEGKSVNLMIEHIFPLLDGNTPLAAIAESKNLDEQELKKNLDQLVSTGVLRLSDVALDQRSFSVWPLTNLLERLKMDPKEISSFFSQPRIVIAGLEGAGNIAAMQLLQSGIRKITLLDPFPLRHEECLLFPQLRKADIGKPRQDVFKHYFELIFDETEIETGPEILNKDTVYEHSKNADFLIGCFDKDFISVHHWLNQAAAELNKPAIFAEVENHLCRIGPLVIPGQTACYMCYRMRTIACADDFTDAMTYEMYLNQKKFPGLSNRGFLPGALHHAGSVLASEVTKVMLALETGMAGWMLEFNAMDYESKKHFIHQKHDCPVCRKKREWSRQHLSLKELAESDMPPGVLADHKETLISPLTGIIKQLEIVPKDPDEPKIPYVYGVALANHSFIADEHGGNEGCSGKGLTLAKAEISALGEAVERYSGACYQPKEVYLSSYQDINKPKLDPAELVLFRDEQYAGLQYSRFQPDEAIGWVSGYSLVQDAQIEIPAISVFMNYKINTPQENICAVTSNGLAAGATLQNAVLSAAMEVIERDAFMITWCNKLPCQRIDPFTHPEKDIREYCTTYDRRGVELRLYRLHTDLPVHVFMGIGYQLKGDDGPCVVVGLGADFDAATAAKSALLEIGQIRPSLKQRMRNPETKVRLAELLENPGLVRDLEDHDLLYSSRKMIHAFDFLFNSPMEAFEWEINLEDNSERLNRLVEELKSKNSDLIYYNLTPPEMEKLGLHTVRVIIPDMQPIHFGHENIRLGGKRLYELPYRLGLKSKIATPSELNENPHPLA
jgi:ribosomal protein S12 methylthiotransferase accessory factor